MTDIQTLINRGANVTYLPQVQFYLTVSKIGQGTVAKNPDQAGYYYGMSVQLTATPATGWSFAGWSGDVSGSTNTVTIVINGNKSITATFTQDQYTLGISTVGSGGVSKNPNQATYVYGMSVQLTATPATGWSFAGWSGDASGSTNTVTITMNGNKSITANFVGLPSILVSPVTYSFGNVKVGTSSNTIVTITNTGYANLSVTIGTLSIPFSYTVSGDLSQIAPNDTRWITVTYQPTSAVSSTATLSITSNDPNNPLVGVHLSGTGVPAEIPPSQQITDILTFFDTSVANGSLIGSGPGGSAQGRLNALKNMIEAAGDLINQGHITEARQQLQNAYLRVDGQPQPPDFATGTTAAQLASMIQQLINSL